MSPALFGVIAYLALMGLFIFSLCRAAGRSDDRAADDYRAFNANRKETPETIAAE